MNKFFKWLLVIFGLLVLLIGITAVVLPLTFDPNNYKDEIQDVVKEETGRDLSIGGDIAWTVFPWLGFEVNDITLSNRRGFADEPMLKVGQASASVKIMPLFSKQIEIGKVTLKDMAVRLTRKANGENNWDDLTKVTTNDPPSGDSANNNDIKSVTISGIQISNANVRWEDAGQVTELSEARLTASGIANQQPFDLEGGFSVDLSDPALNGDIEFSGHVIPVVGNSGLQIEGLILKFEGQHGVAPDRLVMNFEVNADAVMDEINDSMALNNFKFRLHNMNVTGGLVVNALSGNPVFEGDLELAEFNPKTLMKHLGLSAPLTSNPDALTKLSATMSLSGSADVANMKKLDMKLDKSNFAGRFRAKDFSNPDLDFDLAIDSLNLDDYLPPAESTDNTKPHGPSGPSVTSTSNPGGTRPSETDLKSESFRGYTGGGNFKIGKLIIAGMTATNVSTTMSANGKGLRFHPTVADFYGGKNQADIRLDASGDRPILTISEDLSGVQAESLLQDLTGEASRLLGTGSLILNLRTDLSNSASTRQTLSGDLSLNVLDGAFVGIDVADTITQAKNLLGKQDESSEDLNDKAKTEFAKLGLSGLIKNGILASDDFDMSSTLLRATGKGQINFINETIDYVIKPVLSENVRGQGKSTLGQLSGVPIPIKISGNLFEPKISIDIVGAFTESQKAKIDEKKTELTNKLFSKLLGDDDKEKASADEQSKVEDPANESGTDSKSGDKSDDASGEEQQDSAKDLINSLFGSKKDKKKNKATEEQPDNTEPDAGA